MIHLEELSAYSRRIVESCNYIPHGVIGRVIHRSVSPSGPSCKPSTSTWCLKRTESWPSHVGPSCGWCSSPTCTTPRPRISLQGCSLVRSTTTINTALMNPVHPSDLTSMQKLSESYVVIVSVQQQHAPS